MDNFLGIWERVKTDNLENYLAVLGVPEEFRKVCVNQKEVFIISREGDLWKTEYKGGENGELKENASFKVGEPAEYMSVLGKTMKGTIKSVGEKITEEHFLDELKMEVEREIVDGQMYTTTTTNGVTCKAWYDRK